MQPQNLRAHRHPGPEADGARGGMWIAFHRGMDTFIMLTRLAPAALSSPRSLEELEREAVKQVRLECPEVEWIANFAVLGPVDYVDLFRAPNLDSALKVATLVRTFGHAHTEIWPAKSWQDYKALIRHLPGPAGVVSAE